MKAEIKDGNLVLTLPIIKAISKSGKSNVIATTGGNLITELMHDGKPVVIGVNA